MYLNELHTFSHPASTPHICVMIFGLERVPSTTTANSAAIYKSTTNKLWQLSQMLWLLTRLADGVPSLLMPTLSTPSSWWARGAPP